MFVDRVESQHWRLKNLLQDSRGDMCKCWETMDNMLTLQHTEIRASFERSTTIVDHTHNNRMFVRLLGFVSRNALQYITDEWSRTVNVGVDKSACGCTLRRTHGLPCACELAHLSVMGTPIPLELIHSHWKKLHFAQKGDQQQTDETVSEELLALQWDALITHFRTLDIVGKRTLYRKVRELCCPETTSMCPPPEKVKTKGAPKKTNTDGFDCKREPSYFEHVDAIYSAHDNSSTRSSLKTTAQAKKRRLPFLNQFVVQFQPYISDIVNVDSDGNCGYRCIAALLGRTEDDWPLIRQELHKELMENGDLYGPLFGVQLEELKSSLLDVQGVWARNKWMTLPEMGHVIATKYKLVLVSLSSASMTCWTFFPLRGAPTPNHQLICIGFVNGNHWVQVIDVMLLSFIIVYVKINR